MSETDLTRCTVCGGPFSEARIHIDGKAYHQRCSIMSHPPHTWEDYARLSDECERLRYLIMMADNRLECEDCPRCIDLARSYLKEALEPGDFHQCMTQSRSSTRFWI